MSKPYFLPDKYSMSVKIDKLEKQLAKANERVAELEFQHQLLTKRIEPLLDMQEDGEHYARCHLADDIYEAFIKGSSVDALNKFAINQQKKGIKDYISTLDRNLPEKVYLSYLAKDALLYCDNLDKE